MNEKCVIISLGVLGPDQNWHLPDPTKTRCIPVIVGKTVYYSNELLANMLRQCILELEKDFSKPSVNDAQEQKPIPEE